MNEGKLDRAFILSGSYVLGQDGIEGPDEYYDVKKENNYLAIQCARYPERLIGFFSVNPLKEYAIKEVDRCYDELKLPGLKLYFTNSNVDLNNPEHLEKIEGILDSTTEEQHKRIADYIRAWGIENIVFGSDWPYSSPASYINNKKAAAP